MLADIITRHGLIVGNGLEQCKGLITRKRVTKNSVEESTIDFVLLSDDLKDDVKEIIIYEAREHVLTSIRRGTKGIIKSESDHNTIFTKLRFNWNKTFKEKRVELFNLKNTACQEAFKDATTATNNNKYLSAVFEEEGDINELTEKY